MKCTSCGKDIPAGEEYVEVSAEEQCHKNTVCLGPAYCLPEPFFYQHIVPSCKGCGRDIEEADLVVLLTADFDDEGFEFYCHEDPDCLAEALGAQLTVWEEETT